MILDIHSVSFKNFLSFGNKRQEIVIPKGVTFISGINEDKGDSNASGKTSFIDVIIFSLFGKGTRDINKEDYINWKNRKNCELSITFFKNDVKYTIERFIKPDKLNLYINDKIIDDIEPDKRLLQKRIEDIIWFDYKTATNIMYSNLNLSKPILLLSKPDKRKFLEKSFDLKYFTWLNEEVNKNIQDKVKKLTSLEQEQELLDNTIKEIINSNKELKTKINNIDINKLKNKIKNLEDVYSKTDYDSIENDINRRDKDYKDLESQYNFNLTIIGKIEYNIKKISSIGKNLLNIIEKEKENKKEIDRLKLIRDKANSIIIKENEDDLIKELEVLDINVSKINEKINKNNENIAVKKSLLSYQIEKNKIEGKTECPTCKSVINSKNIIESEEKRIKNVRSEISLIENDLSVLKNEREIETNKLKGLKNDINIIREKKNKKIELMSKSSNLENLLNQSIEISKTVKKVKMYKNVILKHNKIKDDITNKNKNFNTLMSSIKEKLNGLNDQLNSLNKINFEIESNYDKLEQNKKLIEEFQSIIDKNDKRIIDIKNKKIILIKDINKSKSIIDYLKTIKTICSDDNVKQYAISSRMPNITKNVNNYINKIGHNFNVVFKDWLDYTIVSPGYSDKKFSNFSGGESRSIDLALRFSIIDTIKLKAKTWPNILIMDEILDSSLDKQSIKEIMSIIDYKQQKDDSKILIVSHKNELEEMNNYNKINVVKRNGFSYVEVI